jgi:molybdenum cofactor cytidylyltransferase
MSQNSPNSAIHACVLAAGSAERFGATKLVQLLHGKPLVLHALEAAQQAFPGRVALVVGHDSDAVVAAADGTYDSLVFNPDYRSGIGTSIAAGVGACSEGADAVVILLADQPLINSAHLFELARHWSGASNEIVASTFAAVLGPPILFPTNAFAALMKMRGDEGAKMLLQDRAFELRSISIPEAGSDVDTPADLQELQDNS